MITFQTETFHDMIDELKPILPIHWQELALDHAEVPLDPDYDLYLALENAGQLHLCTARDNNALIGYFVTFVQNHIHYKSTVFARVDVYYIHPEHRGTGAGAKLFRYHESEMKRLGAKKIINMCKLHQDHGPLFAALGYTHIENIFSKVI